ncbi:AI-2E family transporter [Candidatus Woesearchaeota archaeon]|nr:AI-2E family transporter [Candidatus Woesearchaeota archaeon]
MTENKLVNGSIILMGIVVLFLVLKTLQSFLRPLALAIILTLLMMPLVRFSKKRNIPFSITALFLILVLVFSVSWAGSLLSKEALKIDRTLPIHQSASKIQEIISKFEIGGNKLNIEDYLNPGNMRAVVTSTIKSILQAILAIFSELFLAIIFLIFLIPSYDHILRNLGKTMSRGKIKKVKSALLETEKSIRDYLYTKSLISTGTALVSATILYFFGADFFLIFALLFFTLNFIPNVGSFIAVALALLYYVIVFGVSLNLIWLGALLIAVQVTFGNIIEPKFAGDKLELSPIIILLSLFVWFWVWGIVGMILAIPITSILKIIFNHIDSTKNIARMMS